MVLKILTRYRLLCFAAALLLAVALPWFDAPLAKVALPIEDIKFHVREGLGLAPPPPAETVIVAVDERSVNRLGRWPWDRATIGALLKRLGEARLVGMDIVFSEPTGPEQDRALAEAIAGAGNIVLGFFFRADASVEGTAEDLEALAGCAYRDVRMLDPTAGVRDFPHAEVNLPAFSEAAAGCAFFLTEPDADGLYRHYPLVYLHRGYPFPSLAVQLQRYALNQEAKLTLDRGGVVEFALGGVRLTGASFLRLNYYRESPQLYISALDVLEGKVPPEFFRDRLVVVGVTEMGMYDLRPTPIGPVTPGVLLHLTALGNLLQNSPLVDAPAADLAMAALALLLIALASRRRSLWQRLLLDAAVLMAVVVAADAVFIFGNVWLHEFRTLLPAALLSVSLEGFAFMMTERRARDLRRAFASYVSPDVVQEMMLHPERLGLGGTEREVTALFSDIRGFTTLSERLTPPQLVAMLTDIHDPLTRVILRHRGMLDKYIGDALMALFNAPVEVEDHPARAVRAALEMVRTLAKVNEGFRARGLPAVDVGIGINTGACVVGNMGSRIRFDYTAIGDAINLASRLEGLSKVYGCRIIISEFTCSRLPEDVLVRTLDRVRVKGKNKPVTIFEVMEDTPGNREVRERFETGWSRYVSGDFAEAGREFAALAGERLDPAAGLFTERCRLLHLQPPGEWDGVHVLQVK